MFSKSKGLKTNKTRAFITMKKHMQELAKEKEKHLAQNQTKLQITMIMALCLKTLIKHL